MALEYKGKLTGAQIDALPGQIEGKQNPITLEMLREDVNRLGTIYRLGNIGGQTIDLMPATPSGDPMHYIYEAEGAIYNNTLSVIQRTTPWGEVISHRAGYWYLNGLGNITNEQMRKIYSLGHIAMLEKALQYGGTTDYTKGYAASVRTNLPRVGGYNGSISTIGLLAYNSCIEVFNGGLSPLVTGGTLALNGSYAFYGCSSLKAVVGCGALKLSNISDDTFAGCEALQHINITKLSSSINLQDSPNLSRESLLYMIKNSEATSPITIKLNAIPYLNLSTDSEVVKALTEKPLITLITD